MAFEIVIPRLGWSMEEGTFLGWLKKDGDSIQRGDSLFELEGEKAAQEIEAVDEGILRIPSSGPLPNSLLKVGAIIGYLVAVGESMANETPKTADSSSLPNTSLSAAAAPSVRRLARELKVSLSSVEGTGKGGRILAADLQRLSSLPNTPAQSKSVASPRAKRIAAELNLDWTLIKGSGALGRIRESDVRAAALSKNTTPKGQKILISNHRKVIAQRLLISRQQTVPVTLHTKADATNLVNLREQIKAKQGANLIPSYQDIISKLVVQVLKRHLLLAARWEEGVVVLPAADELHLGIAVDTEKGLLVPVMRNVSELSVSEVAQQSQQLILKAKTGTLEAAEMQGGVFTITNLGAFGIDAFTPVINFPEAAILGLGAIRREAIVQNDSQIIAQHQISLSLTFDHRVVDGAPAARFLQAIVNAIINPLV